LFGWNVNIYINLTICRTSSRRFTIGNMFLAFICGHRCWFVDESTKERLKELNGSMSCSIQLFKSQLDWSVFSRLSVIFHFACIVFEFCSNFKWIATFSFRRLVWLQT
jgi:hypothetical protein